MTTKQAINDNAGKTHVAAPSVPAPAPEPKVPAVAGPGLRYNAYAEFVADAGGINEGLFGNRIKFDHRSGNYTSGQDGHPLPTGPYVALMPTAKAGFQKWREGALAGSSMGFIDGGFRVDRDSLDEADESAWSFENGKPKDPWQQASSFCVVNAQGDGFTVSSMSRGGYTGFVNLLGLFGRHLRMEAGMLPIITFESSSYAHPRKEYGRIHTPVYKIVGWAPEDEFSDVIVSIKGDGAPRLMLPAPADGAAGDYAPPF
ncbi:hypothetical protein [Methylocapsa palsarum]|uniref:Uncharacterized protein n=1 Tax=Methylocapsa palsarum TaxID=1612308 RepID=A0A1I3XQZ0_9HYPH|nr:hypothetical protein [Methylocapsa palsarum]SFK21954.1 hypothetical protein SAMN05444581_10421 [Methylocapsa palsarum]